MLRLFVCFLQLTPSCFHSHTNSNELPQGYSLLERKRIKLLPNGKIKEIANMLIMVWLKRIAYFAFTQTYRTMCLSSLDFQKDTVFKSVIKIRNYLNVFDGKLHSYLKSFFSVLHFYFSVLLKESHKRAVTFSLVRVKMPLLYSFFILKAHSPYIVHC